MGKISGLISDLKKDLAPTCPLCGKGHRKIIYAGVPLKFCVDEECSCIWGIWWWWMNVVPFNGWLWFYEGSYWVALWHWLWHVEEREE